MKAIGFRCYKDGFSYVVLEGTQESPIAIAHSNISFPANYERCQGLAWVRMEVGEIIDRYQVTCAALKRIEPNARKKSMDRIEVEGVVREAVYTKLGCECITRIKSQLRRDISGFAEPARYLQKVLSARDLQNLNTSKFSEAALASISELPGN